MTTREDRHEAAVRAVVEGGVERSRHAHDAVALGALARAGEPGVHGVEELGRRLLEAHGHDLEAVVGWLALRLLRLEDR